MNAIEILKARDELLECLALHVDAMRINASLYPVGNRDHNPALYVNVSPRTFNSPNFDDFNDGLIYQLKHKNANLWTELDGECALAIKSAIKAYIEGSIFVQKIGFSDNYNLGYEIKSDEKLPFQKYHQDLAVAGRAA